MLCHDKNRGEGAILGKKRMGWEALGEVLFWEDSELHQDLEFSLKEIKHYLVEGF